MSVQFIADILAAHATIPGQRCACGHAYKIGQSISYHRALHIEAGLRLLETGASDEQALLASRSVVMLSGAE